MKNKQLYLALFAIMCIIQWLIPYKMISDQNTILEEGKAYRFKTAPIDPIDPFRGNYVQLYFEHNEYKTKDSTYWTYDEPVYVILKTDSSGYAVIDSLSRLKPEASVDY